MKKVVNGIRNSKGFVSIEFILVAGIIIVIGSVIMLYFSGKADSITTTAGNQLEKANGTMTE